MTTTTLTKIGNSQGFRIPKILLEQSGITGPVSLEAQRGTLVIKSIASKAPRENWGNLIDSDIAANGQMTDTLLEDFDVAMADGLDEL